MPSPAASIILAAVITVTGLGADSAHSPKPVSFRDDVAPILVRSCLGCHNAKKPASGLDMTTFAALKRGGKTDGTTILEAGDPEASGLVESVSADGSPRMPYKLPPLPASQIATLTRWIKEGARFDGPSETETAIASLVDPLKGLPGITVKVAASDPATAVAFSPDGNVLAASVGRSVIIYDVKTGKPKTTWPDHPGPISTLRFADRGRLLVAVGGRPAQFGTIAAWDLVKGARVFEVREPGDTFLAADVSPDGATLAAASYNRRVLIWDAVKGTLIRELKDHTDSVHGAAFSPDGTLLATCGADRTVKVWDWRKGTKLATLSDATAELYDVVFSPDGKRIMASGVDRSIRIWSATEKAFPLVRSVFAHDAAVINLVVASHGNLLATCAEDRTIKLWDLTTMDSKSVLTSQSDWVQGLGFSPDGRRLAVGRHDGSVELLDASTGKSALALREPPRRASDKKPALSRNPSLGAPLPRGGVRGTRRRVTLNGEGVGRATSILAPGGGLAASIVAAAKPDPNRLEVDFAIAADARPGIHRFTTVGPAGIPGDRPFDVSPFPETAETEPNDGPAAATNVIPPSTITGTISKPGDFDHFAFEARGGRAIVFEVVAKALGSSIRPVLSILDESGRTLATAGPTDDAGNPVLIFPAPRDGRYLLAVADADYGGSENHFYRIRSGETPRVASVFPLGVKRGESTTIKVEGVNLNGVTGSTVTASTNTVAGTIVPVPVPLPGSDLSPEPRTVVVADGPQTIEVEPNDSRDQAQALPAPGGVSGRIGDSGDVDLFRFHAKKGERRIVELYGQRLGTPIDSVVEVLDQQGRPVPRAVLRLVDKTEVAFRDHSSRGNGIRLTHWNNLEVNDYVLVGRELMRIFALPRNPDDDCRFWSEGGQRLGMLGTTPEHHPMNQPIYKVDIHPPGSQFPSGGTEPVTLDYRNDDGGPRFGKDSMLSFDPPEDGDYLVRVQDSRSAGGADFAYHLVVRPSRPDYRVTSGVSNLNVPRGGTRLLPITLSRIDGFNSAVDVWAEGLPVGVKSTGTRIDARELEGLIAFSADESAPAFSPPSWKLMARPVGGESREIAVGDSAAGGRITVTEPPNLHVQASRDRVVIHPGEEVTLKLSVDRGPVFSGRVPVLVQNLPQGVRVLNIGLNGVLITEKQTERTVVIRAEPWAEPLVRPFYAVGKAESAGTDESSAPIVLEVTK